MKISGICGSLRKESWNKLLLQILLKKLSQNNNISTQEIDISDFPLYNADIESIAIPESVVAAKEKIIESDLLIFSSPAYNGSYSGVMKNIVDWLSRPPKVLDDKNALVIGCTPGMSGTLLGFTHLNHVLFNLNLNVFNQPRILVSGVHNKIQSDGKIINETLEKLINNSAKNPIFHIHT